MSLVPGAKAAPTVREHNLAEARKWIERGFKVVPSDIGARACVLLGLWLRGFHHIPEARHIDWTNTNGIAVQARPGLSTFDAADLTQLVFLAHDECLRVEVQLRPVDADEEESGGSEAKEQWNGLWLFITARQRVGQHWEKHPTLEQAVAEYRKAFPESEVRS